MASSRAGHLTLVESESKAGFENEACSEREDLPPSPSRARTGRLSAVSQNQAEWSRLKEREEQLNLQERELKHKQSILEEQSFELQEERRQHEESRHFLVRKTSELEAREARAEDREKRLSGLSVTPGSSVGTPPSSSKKMRRLSPFPSTPPRKQAPAFADAEAQTPCLASRSPSREHAMAFADVEDQTPFLTSRSPLRKRAPAFADAEAQTEASKEAEVLAAAAAAPVQLLDSQPVQCVASKPNGRQRQRSCGGCLGCACRFGVCLQMIIKVLVLLAITLIPQLPEETMQNAAAWLPLPSKTAVITMIGGDQGSSTAPATSTSGVDIHMCREALQTLRAELEELQLQRPLPQPCECASAPIPQPVIAQDCDCATAPAPMQVAVLQAATDEPPKADTDDPPKAATDDPPKAATDDPPKAATDEPPKRNWRMPTLGTIVTFLAVRILW